MTDQPNSVYLDYAASTPVEPRVVEAMTEVMLDPGSCANPSSTHAAGRLTVDYIERAAEQLGALVNAPADTLIWTSGATESDNLAILGAAEYRRKHGKHLISMRTEHKAVTDAFAELEKRGFEVTWVAPEANGMLDIGKFEAALRDDTQLVSIMHVNNETGVIQDIEQIGTLCRARDILFHVDAAQSLGKLPIDLATLPVDLMSMTAHKVYGPKGIGALYIAKRPGVHVDPLLFGGGQQRRLRPGTLPVQQIVGFGVAAEIARSRVGDDIEHLTALRERFWGGICDLPGILLNGTSERGFPGILNVSIGDLEGESLLLALEPLQVATGSACNSQLQEPSYVLRALGRSDAEAQSAIRFSFGRPTTAQDVDFAVDRYCSAVNKLRRIAPGRAA